ncbi:hypothetical protein OIE69_44320 (plasmid) [Actinacidiphila glaucinigra]|uniref:hypothetical protein n=1 Tax=Actinacidiphila glaucinigra TaxID=235986 RepID=UPI002DDC551B|nr:hypothetical protein [Actinacidiphila glaucinigra]WSD65931.1 hypothetical protein OIE69_44320 [Actinacidiphila glaucinigra]
MCASPDQELTSYEPAPGTEYPYSVSDIARAAAKLLGPGYHAESGHWGVTGAITGPHGQSITIGVDHEGDLYVKRGSDQITYLPDACAAYSVESNADAVAKAVLAFA